MALKNKLECFFKASFATSGLYYIPITIVNDNLRVINKLDTSLTDDTRVIIYDHHMFIVQAISQSFVGKARGSIG
jgi:hypothetical protein